MTHLDEHLGVWTYFQKNIRTVDGLAWIATCVVSIFCIFDILLKINMMPLRDIEDPGKALILLIFSPLLVFLVLVWMRQLPARDFRVMPWIRAVFCIVIFLTINF